MKSTAGISGVVANGSSVSCSKQEKQHVSGSGGVDLPAHGASFEIQPALDMEIVIGAADTSMSGAKRTMSGGKGDEDLFANRTLYAPAARAKQTAECRTVMLRFCHFFSHFYLSHLAFCIYLSSS